MVNFAVTFTKAGVRGLLSIICITSIAIASGDTEIPNGNRDYAANSGQHTLLCNGTWCVMNEEYCDKRANKCLGCVYKKPNCTQHLDCLQYCIDKGVEQAILENPGTATEENSTPAWSLPLFVVFLILFLVSCVCHIVVFLWWFHQRKQYSKGIIKEEEEVALTKGEEHDGAKEEKVTENDGAKQEKVTENDGAKQEKVTENDGAKEQNVTENDGVKEQNVTKNDGAKEQNVTELKATTLPIQEESSKSNEKSHEFKQY